MTDTAKREAVQPIPVYFLRHWSRYLAPEGVALVISGRQLAYVQRAQTPEGQTRARVRIAGRCLARMAGVAYSTVCKFLEAPGMPWQPYLSTFLQPASGDGCFFVRRDDPLAPHHVRGLALYLLSAVGEGDDDGVALIEALEALRDLPWDEALAALEGQGDLDVTALEKARYMAACASAATVADVADLLGFLPTTPIFRLRANMACRKLHEHLTAPRRVVLLKRAFWRDWATKLGLRAMGLILNLRTRCFFDRRTGEVREFCRVSMAELAAELGITERQLCRLMDEEGVGDFVRCLDRGGNQRAATRWWVRMGDNQTSAGQQSDMRGLAIGHPRATQRITIGHLRAIYKDLPEKDSLQVLEKGRASSQKAARRAKKPKRGRKGRHHGGWTGLSPPKSAFGVRRDGPHPASAFHAARTGDPLPADWAMVGGS